MSVIEQDDKLVFTVEPLASCRSGIERLIESHGRELSFYKDQKGRVDPNWTFYGDLDRAEALTILIARKRGVVVGYFFIVKTYDPHYRNLTLAYNDTFFLHPAYRKGMAGYVFVREAVRTMEALVAGSPMAVLYLSMKARKHYPAIMKRLGFVAEDIRYSKMIQNKEARLCQQH